MHLYADAPAPASIVLWLSGLLPVAASWPPSSIGICRDRSKGNPHEFRLGCPFLEAATDPAASVLE